ncbi:MAG: PqqD family protein [Candidatus Hodarchaeota archaeon]
MLALKPDTRLVLEEEITIQAIAELDHYYAFNVSTGDQFQLNHTSHWVLESIEGGITFQELTDKFAGGFALSSDKAKEDLMELIKFALESGIIKEVRK